MTDKFKRDPENGMLIGPDECHYDTEQDVYHFAVLGLCGCGNPADAYNLARAILRICDRRKYHETRSGKDWLDIEAESAKLIAAKPEMTEHLLLHFLTKCNVIEHGGSVGGSWLTATGEAIVDLPPRDDDGP